MHVDHVRELLRNGGTELACHRAVNQIDFEKSIPADFL